MTPKAARIFLASQPPIPSEPTGQQASALDAIRKSDSLLAEYEHQIQIDQTAAAALSGITVPPETAATLQTLHLTAASSRGKARFNPLDPATLSVTIGFLLMVGLLTWHFLGRAGVFPEEALSIAEEGRRLRTDQFDVVEDAAGSLGDWFLMKGFDKFRIPEEFSKFQAVGARIFKIENQPVAVLAVPDNFMFFMVFDPAPFGISVEPQGSWRTIEFDNKFAAGIREIDGMCFMVVLPGNKQTVQDLISANR